MSISEIGLQVCSVARAVSLIGDPWTLMLLRELFLGSRRFDEFQRHTGAPPHLISQRLRRLLDAGVIERRPYQERPLRHEYALTDKGVALWPVLSALREWGDRWQRESGGVPVRVLHRGCGGVARLHHRCERCGETLDAHAVEVKLSPRARADRQAQGARRAPAEGLP